MSTLTGIAASPGIAVGPVHVHVPARLAIPEGRIADDRRDAEIEVFRGGRERARLGLEALTETVRATKGDDLAEVFEGHAEILMDDDLGAAIEAAIRDDGLPALAAARDVMAAQKAEFLALEDDYMRQRADDIEDIARRLMLAMAGIEETCLETAPQGAIIVADDLTPSDTARLDPSRVGGFVVACGGRTSHVAIMARTLEIPAVVGCPGILEAVAGAADLALDGSTGRVVIAPDAETHADFDRRRAAYAAEVEAMRALAPPAGGDPRRPADRPRRQHRHACGRRGGTALEPRRRRPLPHRIPLHEPAEPAGRGRAVSRLSLGRPPDGGQAGDHPHARRRRRQARRRPRLRRRGEPFPRLARRPHLRLRTRRHRTQPRARGGRARPRPDRRDPARFGRRRRLDDVSDDRLRRGGRRPRRHRRGGEGTPRPRGQALRFAQDRRDDRDARRRADRRSAGREGRLLLDRLERPDPVHARRRSRQRARPRGSTSRSIRRCGSSSPW